MAATGDEGQQSGGASEEAAPAQAARDLVEKINELRQREERVPEALALCEEVLQRFDSSGDGEVRVQVARALVNKAACLGQLGRYEESLATCDEAIRRYDGTSEPKLKLAVAKMLSYKGFLLELQGQGDEARRLYEEVLRRHDATAEGELMGPVATALLGKASLEEEPEAQLSLLDEVIRRFSAVGDVATRGYAAMAAMQKSGILRRLGRREPEILALGEQMLRGFGQERDRSVLACLDVVLSLRSSILEDMNRFDEALASYDDTLRVLGAATYPALRDRWAIALLNKAFHLKKRGLHAQALPCYDALVEQLGSAPEANLRERAAGGLVEKAAVLQHLERNADALATYDEGVQRWAGDSATEVLVQVAEALLDKALLQVRMQQLGEAMSSLAIVFRKFEGATQEPLREQAAKAILSTSVLLFAMNQVDDAHAVAGKAWRKLGGETGGALLRAASALLDKTELVVGLGMLKETLSVFDDVMGRITEPAESLREDRIRAFVRAGLVLRSEARRRWTEDRKGAEKLLEKAREKALEVLKFAPEAPFQLGQAGYLCFVTGRREEARPLLEKALRLGGEAQRGHLLAESVHPFLEGEEDFRALVRSL